jgi:hypothetical protein
MTEFRDAVGVVLRLPVVAVLTALWVVCIWPLVVGFALLALLVRPVLYPFAYALLWLTLALQGSKHPVVLPDYWNGYPDKYLGWLKMGFPTLKDWLLKGWE